MPVSGPFDTPLHVLAVAPAGSALLTDPDGPLQVIRQTPAEFLAPATHAPAAHHVILLDARQCSEKTQQALDRALTLPLPLITVVASPQEGEALMAHGTHDYLLASELTEHSLRRSLRHYHWSEARTPQDLFHRVVEHNPDAILILDQKGVIRFANPAAKALFRSMEPNLIGEWLGLPIAKDNATELAVLQKSGETAIVEMRVVEIQWRERPAYLATLRDITAHKNAELAERKQRNLAETLRDTALAINKSTNLAPALRELMQVIHRTVHFDLAVVIHPEDDQIRLYSYGDVTLPDALPLDAIPQLQQQLQHQQPSTEQLLPSAPSKIKSIINVPTIFEQRSIGCLSLQSTRPSAYLYHQDKIDVLMAIAPHIAIALRKAQLYKQAQELAIMEERQQIARELHDSISQVLFSASMISEGMLNDSDRLPTDIQDLTKDLNMLTRLAQAEMRTLLVELSPDQVAKGDLNTRLEHLALVAGERGEFDLTLSVPEETNLPGQVKIAIYRIVQEAINNVYKHAQASHVQVTMQPGQGGDGVEVRIKDNGRGFDPQQNSAGMGLNNIRERARQVNATVEIISQPGEGTEIILNW